MFLPHLVNTVPLDDPGFPVEPASPRGPLLPCFPGGPAQFQERNY